MPEAQPETPVESQFQPVEGADEMLDMPLGTLIFRAGLIAPQQLEDALAEGLRSGKRLGEVLLSRGWLSEEDLARLLAGQKGLPYADLDKIAIDRELARAMSYDDARSEMALPVVTEFGLPVVAMADPDETAMERLRAQLGPEVRFVVGAPSVLVRLIDEVLGDAPTPGLVVAPATDYQFAPVEPAPVAAPVAATVAEPATEPESAPLEPVAVDSSDQEAAAPAPEPSTPEIRPIIAEGEIEYPTFGEFQPIPETESITKPEEQLPAEVQMGEFGYYDDPSLLEGNAWRAGEAGPPPAAEPPEESTDLSAGQYGAEQPIVEAEQPFEEAAAPIEEAEQPIVEAGQPFEEAAAPIEEADQPIEEAGQPFEEAAAPIEEAEQPIEEAEQPFEEAAAPIEEAEQPVVEAEAPVEQAWEETPPEVAPEPVASYDEEPAYEQPPEGAEEVADASSGEEDQPLTAPAWMRGEVNVITADVADFIDSGASVDPDTPSTPAGESGDVAADESQPVVSEDEAAAETAPIVEDEAEAEAVELAPSESAAAEIGTEPPTWASEPSEPAEEVTVEDAGNAPTEPAAAPQEVLAPGSEHGAFELVLRLVDGDRIPIGSFDSVDKAQDKAAEVVKQFAETEEGRWPFIGGRFLRPETIVSIDVEQHGSGWGGSNARGRMFSGGDSE
jgi:exonuclease VII small subunit